MKAEVVNPGGHPKLRMENIVAAFDMLHEAELIRHDLSIKLEEALIYGNIIDVKGQVVEDTDDRDTGDRGQFHDTQRAEPLGIESESRSRDARDVEAGDLRGRRQV